MRALVLFRGTGSVDRSLEQAGFKVDSLDIDPKCNATWTCDVLEWDEWRHMAPGSYDFVFASPPCTEYSRARTTAKTPRNLELADRIVQRTLNIIHELAPKAYLVENPQKDPLDHAFDCVECPSSNFICNSAYLQRRGTVANKLESFAIVEWH